MNPTMNLTSYWEVAHLYVGEGRGPLPNPYPTIYELFKFCVIDALPVPVNLFNNLFTSFDANNHKTNNRTVPVVQCTKVQNKHELLTPVHSVISLKTTEH